MSRTAIALIVSAVVLASGALIAVEHSGTALQPARIDPNQWLMEKAAPFAQRKIAIEFYNPHDDASLKHLAMVRKIVAENSHELALVEVDITKDLVAARSLYGAEDELKVPYTLVMLVENGGVPVILSCGMPFPDRSQFDESQIRAIIENGLKGR